jgi:thiol-disulfide isomerase/thioredoxin
MGFRFSLLTGLGLSAALGCSSASPPLSQAALPAPLPATTVMTLAGEPTSVAHVAEGRVALVSLWATWCEACVKEMDSLNRLDAKATAEGSAVVIGIDIGEEREKVAAFAQRRGLRYVQLVDEGFAFADALGQRRLPATLVIDRRGEVVFRGEALDARGLDAMRRALAQP